MSLSLPSLKLLKPMTELLQRLASEDEGQDLVEYALLTGFVALATVAGVNAIGTAINMSYSSWDAATQNLWEPQAPAGS